LNIKGMKKRFGKSVSDQGLAMFVSQLIYKSLRNGGMTVKIDRWAASTKTCSNCGTKHTLTLAQRQFICDVCGLDISRDLNAAINIKEWAWEILMKLFEKHTAGTAGIQACGVTSDGDATIDASSYVTMKQEKFCIIDTEASTL
jgi:predicted RNA-binding Zn-ribbon protein involved in translation (DUF1610 family)